jgi:hypothetical protein
MYGKYVFITCYKPTMRSGVGHHFAAGAKHEIESFAKNKGAAGSRGWF